MRGDTLLLMTSIGKEFGIKIPNEAVGPDAIDIADATAALRFGDDHAG